MRRGAEILTFVLLAFGGCEGEPHAPIDVRLEFRTTGTLDVTTFDVECEPGGDVTDICAEIQRAPELYFPEQSIVCSLPVPYLYLAIDGSYRGEELKRVLTCTDADTRAIDAWSKLLGYEPPPLDRR